jgi:putative iron-dependent peroxidase
MSKSPGELPFLPARRTSIHWETNMEIAQPGILAPGPRFSRFLFLQPAADESARDAVEALGQLPIDESSVVGIGHSLVLGCGGDIPGLRVFPALSGPDVIVPSTQAAAWIWLRGREDPGELVHRARELGMKISPFLELGDVVDGFAHDPTETGLGRDLTGYEDGTENPQGQAAVEAAVAADGSSFVAVQQWVHDLSHFESLTQTERDHIIGRRRSDNEELDDAPESAHVKRTAQESFDPEAFVLRRSTPWADADGEGLVFVAFGRTLDAFEVMLRRMAGLEDGIVDSLFRFSRPVSGGYFWCPPVAGGRLDLTALRG